jgi:hypothetical protein
MVKFIPVRYQSFDYPDFDYIQQPQIQEVTCNLGTEMLRNPRKFDFLSLHTDPSIVWSRTWNKYPAKKEKMHNSIILPEFPTIFKNFEKNMIDSTKDCVSILWSSEQWSEEFAGFLVKVTGRIKCERIKVIEIHSPFDKYCDYSLVTFIKRYRIFEKEILKYFPSADIVIENQYTHRGKEKYGNFLLSKVEDILSMSELLKNNSDLKLRLVLDIPQLMSAHYDNNMLSEDNIKEVLDRLIESDVRNNIRSTHIWGYDFSKTKGKQGAHGADLNTYLGKNKKLFLQKIHDLFNDGKSRYFVPEVGSACAIKSIVQDLHDEAGVEFVKLL